MQQNTTQNRFIDFLNQALTLGASSKTTRYYLRDIDLVQVSEKMLNTAYALSQAWGESNKVVVDGIQYDTSEYEVPTFMLDIIRLGKVYVNTKAALVREPIISISKVSDSSDIFTPIALKRFIARFNENQTDDSKLKASAVPAYVPTLLSRVGLIRCESDTYVINDSGDAEDFSLTGFLVPIKFDGDVAKYYPSLEPELEEAKYHAIFN